MPQRKLGELFRGPQSVAVVGASGAGAASVIAVWKRLRAHPYAGRATGEPQHREVFRRPCYAG